MKEVFIAYTKTTPIALLKRTLEAWDDPQNYEPVAVEVKDLKSENLIRVAAEALSKADYSVAPLGSKPGDPVKEYKKGEGIRVEACPSR